MKTRHYSKVKYAKDAKEVVAGDILIAQPFCTEEIYERTIILILENNSNGATGILLNKKSNLMIGEALPSLNILKPLLFGGESDTKVISYLHTNSDIPDSIHLGDNLFWGGNYEIVREMISNYSLNLNEISFFAGFVHWDYGQLEEEISNNKWWLSEPVSSELFTISPEDLWSHCLDNCGNLYSLFGEIPDPSFN